MSDPDNVFVVLEWADVQGAQRWAEGVDTHEGMKWSTSGSISELAVVEKVLETDA